MRCSLAPRPYFHQIRPTNSRGLLVTHEPTNVLDNLLTEVVESQMPCDVHPIWTSSPVLPGWCHELHPFLHLMNLFKHMSYTRQNNLKLGSCTFLLGKIEVVLTHCMCGEWSCLVDGESFSGHLLCQCSLSALLQGVAIATVVTQ